MQKNRSLLRTTAWIIGSAVIVTSLILILLYGHTFGYFKSILWLTAFVISVAISLLIVEPVKQLALSTYLTMCTRGTHFDIEQEQPLLSNKWKEYRRAFNSYSRKVVRDTMCWDNETEARSKLNENYLIYYRELTSDLFVFTLFISTLLLVVLGSRDHMALYSNRMASFYTVQSKYVRGPLKPIIGDRDFHDYLSQVLVPTLHPSETRFL